MTDFRLQLLVKDHGMIQPVIDALETGETGEALRLPPCKTLKEMQDILDYLQTKTLKEEADRLYKNKQHKLLKIYNKQLEALKSRMEYSQEQLYQEALETIKAYPYNNMRLTLAGLANLLNVSERSLQYAFHSKETTFSEVLKQVQYRE